MTLLLLVGLARADDAAVLVQSLRQCARPIAGHLPPGVEVGAPPAVGGPARRAAARMAELGARPDGAAADEWLALADSARGQLHTAQPLADQLSLRWTAASAAALGAVDPQGAADAAGAWQDLLRHHPMGDIGAAVSLHLGIDAFDQLGCSAPTEPEVAAERDAAEQYLTRALAADDPEIRLLASRYRAALAVYEGRPLAAAHLLEAALVELRARGGAEHATELLADLAGAWALAGVLEDAERRARAIATALGQPDLTSTLLWQLGARYAGEFPPASVSADATIACAHARAGQAAGVDAELLYRALRLDSSCLVLLKRSTITDLAANDDVARPPDVYEPAARRILAAGLDAEGSLAQRSRLSLVRLDLGFAPGSDERLAADLAAFTARCAGGPGSPTAPDGAATEEQATILAGLAGDTVDSADAGVFEPRTRQAMGQAVALARGWLSCFPGDPRTGDVQLTLARAQNGAGDPDGAMLSADLAARAATPGSALQREALREGVRAAGQAAKVDATTPWAATRPAPARRAFITWATRFADAFPADSAASTALLEAAHQLVLDQDADGGIARLADVCERYPQDVAATTAATRLLDLVDSTHAWAIGAPALARCAAALPASLPLAHELADAATSGEFLAGVTARESGDPAERSSWILAFLAAHPDCQKRVDGLRMAARDAERAAAWAQAGTAWQLLAQEPTATVEDAARAARSLEWTGRMADAADAWQALAARFGAHEGYVEAGALREALDEGEAAHGAWLLAASKDTPPAVRADALLHLARLASANGNQQSALRAANRAAEVAPVGTALRARAAWLVVDLTSGDTSRTVSAAERTLDELTEAAPDVRAYAGRLRMAALDARIRALASTPTRTGSARELTALATTLLERRDALLADTTALGDASRYGLAAQLAGVQRRADIADAFASAVRRIPPPSDLSPGAAAELHSQLTDIAMTAQLQAEDFRELALDELLTFPAGERPYTSALTRMAVLHFRFPDLARLGGDLSAPTRADAVALTARLAADPGNAEARALLTRALLTQGHPELAARVLAANPSSEPAPALLALTGVLAARDGDEIAALAAWKAALEQTPDEPVARRALGLLALRCGDWGAALDLLFDTLQPDDPALVALQLARSGARPEDLSGLDAAATSPDERRIAAFAAFWFDHDPRAAWQLLRDDPKEDPLRAYVAHECGDRCAAAERP